MNNHRSGPAVRGAQVALYRTGLVHVLDRMRPGWDASAPTLPAALRCTDASVS
jgi:hypothetical protein